METKPETITQMRVRMYREAMGYDEPKVDPPQEREKLKSDRPDTDEANDQSKPAERST
jgi:hypothetical protein